MTNTIIDRKFILIWRFSEVTHIKWWTCLRNLLWVTWTVQLRLDGKEIKQVGKQVHDPVQNTRSYTDICFVCVMESNIRTLSVYSSFIFVLYDPSPYTFIFVDPFLLWRSVHFRESISPWLFSVFIYFCSEYDIVSPFTRSVVETSAT